MDITPVNYAARLNIDYPEKLDRLSSAFRLTWILPIYIILTLISGTGQTVEHTVYFNQAGEIIKQTRNTSGALLSGFFIATALIILFRKLYPRWWIDFVCELTRFGAYLFLLMDTYPSTVDEQSVHLEIDYPDVKTELKNGMPLVKWFLVTPHLIVLAFLAAGAVFVWIFAWFNILFTSKYPKDLFDYIVGVMRWGLRVNAYAFLLVTDRYPPFSLR